MTELEDGEAISQRELASRLGIAVGLVNSYLKNFVAKGYVRIKNYPRNRYAYLLTPKGLAEKSRLAFQHLNYFTDLYTVTRQGYLELFRRLKGAGVTEVVFCGADEVAEIAYLSLQEAGMALVAVFDVPGERNELFGHPVVSLAEGVALGNDIIITSLKRQQPLLLEIIQLGADEDLVHIAGASG
jgi:DNA-binding MarR family transcriptional regulator